MSRISWTDEEDYPGQFELWQSNCHRSIMGRSGLSSLRELEAALLALPFKRLLSGRLEQGANVCAIGALVHHKEIRTNYNDDYQMVEIGMECGMPRLVAWKVVEINDMEGEDLTSEARYDAVLSWVQARLIEGYRRDLSKTIPVPPQGGA